MPPEPTSRIFKAATVWKSCGPKVFWIPDKGLLVVAVVVVMGDDGGGGGGGRLSSGVEVMICVCIMNVCLDKGA